MRLVTLFLVIAMQAAQAQQPVDWAGGIGVYRCGELSGFLEANESNSRISVISWIQGYISALNMARLTANAPVSNIPKPKTIQAYLEKYCRENPLDRIFTAGSALFIDLVEEVEGGEE